MTAGPFVLYPEERHWWSFNDYGAVVDVVRRLGARTVLEFGPGSSTLSLIEGGAQEIHTCEDDPEWAAIYEARLVSQFPDVVRLHLYDFSDPITIPALDGMRFDLAGFDLALIDGPRNTELRPVSLAYALARCRHVLLPLEEQPPGHEWLRPIVLSAAAASGRPDVEIITSGPLAGAFALIGPA